MTSDLQRDIARLERGLRFGRDSDHVDPRPAPHDGHAIRSRPLRSRSPIALEQGRPVWPPSTGSAVSWRTGSLSPIAFGEQCGDAGHTLD